jgi:hypothetical protein
LNFHKEKEMVAFRKLIPVLALFALLLGVQSVTQAQTLTCNVTAGVPPVVRAEGFTELLGDIIISCTQGGNQAPFLANFQVFLNTNVTSRLVSGDLSEAVLMIDDPGVAGRATCVSPSPANNGAPLQGIGFGTAGLPAGCAGSATTGTNPQVGTYNAFLGERTRDITGGSRENSLVWTNIPVVPPGTVGTRTFRITNLRGNASGVGPGGLGLPGQIVAFISISGVSSLALNNPQQIVGYVQPGMAFDLRNCGNTDSSSIGVDQCVSNAGGQRDLFDNPAADAEVPALASFRFREGFQSAFKSRIAATQSTAPPGTSFTGSESGFVLPAGAVTTVNNQLIGVADSGTRLAVRFTNVPANLRIFVGNRNGFSGTLTDALPRAVLVSTDQNGAGGTSPTPVTGLTVGFGLDSPYAPARADNVGLPANSSLPSYVGPRIACSGRATLRAVEVPIVNGTGVAVWEVVDNGQSLAGTLEDLYFPYGLAYRYAAGSNQVGLGTGTVVGNLAPFYTSAGTMSQILPIPRFIASTASPINALRIQACQTNLLFPYVTNWAGFDTGIAIANTSDDPFSDPQNRRQAGRCRMNYFGKLPNGNAPTTLREETDREVAAGETITMVLSTGGGLGLRGNANFQGYIIAQCDFRFAHGFAFITDGPIGQARVAEGYLALVLDGADAGRVRGQSSGEVRGH